MNRRDEDALHETETFPKVSSLITYGPNDPSSPDANDRFDPSDEDLMHDVCGPHLGPVISQLLMARRLHRVASRSFGADPQRTVDHVMPLLDELFKAALKTWEEDL